MANAVRPVAAALASLLLVPSVPFAAEPPGAESPQAVVARMEKAAETGDFPEMIACLAPDARREMALAMVAGAGMVVAFMGMGGAMAAEMGEAMVEGLTGEEAAAEQEAEMAAGQKAMEVKAAEMQKRYEAILERHGVTAMLSDESEVPEDPAERSAALAKLFAKTDDVALISDLLGFMGELGDSEESGESAGPGEPEAPFALPGEVTDYRIEGDRATARAGDETIEFIAVDGRWYLQPDDQAPDAPPAP